MKQVFALFLTVAMVFFLAGCNRATKNDETVPSQTPSVSDVEQNRGEDVPFKPIVSALDYFEADTFYEPSVEGTVHYLFHEPIRDTGKSYPLIIFLHGLGDTVSKFNPGTATTFVNSLIKLENESEKYSAYTLVPTTPLASEGWWVLSQMSAFKKLIPHLVQTYNIDAKRIYISGISMGGFLTCQFVNEMPPDTFAAAVPLSGARNMTYPDTLSNTAFHIYHSTNDAVVNVSCSRSLNEQLRAHGHPNVQYTEFPHGDHVSPLYSVFVDDCYVFFDWLFAQRLP